MFRRMFLGTKIDSESTSMSISYVQVSTPMANVPDAPSFWAHLGLEKKTAYIATKRLEQGNADHGSVTKSTSTRKDTFLLKSGKIVCSKLKAKHAGA